MIVKSPPELPESVIQFPIEYRSLGEWHPATHLGVDPDSNEHVIVYRVGTSMHFANVPLAVAEDFIRPRVEKRKRWFLIDRNDMLMSNTKDENVAREWCNCGNGWTLLEVEYQQGERPTFDSPPEEPDIGNNDTWCDPDTQERPTELRKGMRVRCCHHLNHKGAVVQEYQSTTDTATIAVEGEPKPITVPADWLTPLGDDAND